MITLKRLKLKDRMGVAFANMCFTICIIVVLMVMIPYIFVPAGVFEEYHQRVCKVENIVYPTDIPDHGNTTGWARCDCGKRCLSWSPCVQIYTNVSDEAILRQKFYDTMGECSFHDDYCPNGEDIRNIRLMLDEAREIFEQYDNRTLNCYYNDDVDYIFMEMSWNWELTAAFLTLIVFFISMIICVNCNERKERRLKNPKIEVSPV